MTTYLAAVLAIREEGTRQLAEASEWYRVHAARAALADPHTRRAYIEGRLNNLAAVVTAMADTRAVRR